MGQKECITSGRMSPSKEGGVIMLFFRLSGTTTDAKEIGNLRDKYGMTDRARTINITPQRWNAIVEKVVVGTDGG